MSISDATSDDSDLCIGCGSELDGMMASPHCLRCLLRLASDPSSLDEREQELSSVIGHGVLPRFDDYELIEEIARGGMGVVYRAKQLSLSRIVAVKMILAGQLATPEAVRRFQFEAEAAAKLDHPGIVPIYEVGESESQHFFSMKLIDGANLAESIDAFVPRPEMDATTSRQRQLVIAELMQGVSEAIAFAHEHGVMHRDLKPTNIMLDQDGNPHLTDFGLAKLAGAEEQGIAATLTATVLGSPAYMSPEQAIGDSANVTVASDVYGIGAVLYELLTGRPPFVGNSALETLRAVVDEDPLSPSSLNPQIDPDLDTIAMKCLEKKPAQRYSNAVEVVEELNRFQQGRPILARPTGTIERIQRWCARKPVVASLIGALMLVTVAGLLGIGWQWRTAIIERARADENASQATQERDAALWQTYRSSIGLASNALQLHQMETVRRALENAPEKHRNWEWQYFRNQLNVPHQQFKSNMSGTPSALWFSADGTQLAMSRAHEFEGSSTTNIVWNSETGNIELETAADSLLSRDLRYLATLNDGIITIQDRLSDKSVKIDHSSRPLRHMVSFSEFGSTLVSRSNVGLHAWNTTTGQHKYELPGKPNAFYGPRILTFGKRQRLYQGGREMLEFDANSNTLVSQKSFENGEIHTVAHSWQANLFATAKEFPANNAQLWDARSGELVATLEGHRNVVYRMKFNDDGSLLATGSLDATVRVWDTGSGNLLFVLTGHTDTIQDFAFDPTGRFLATGSYDRTARIWDLKNGSQATVVPVEAIAFKVAFHPNGNSVATADDNGNVRLWNISNYLRHQFSGHEGFVYGIDHHPGGNLLASSGWDKTVRIWTIGSGSEVSMIATKEIAHGVRFSRDGNLFAYTTPNQLGIVETETMKTVCKFGIQNIDMGTKAGVRAGFSFDGKQIGCAIGKTPMICDSRTGGQISQLEAHDGIVTDCTFFSPRNQWVTVGGSQIRFHDANDFSVEYELAVPGELMSATFSSDQTRLCVATSLDTVHLYDTSAGVPRELAVLKHPSTVYSVAFSQDGSRIFAGCHDGTIRVWDTETSSVVAVLQGHSDYVHAISMNPKSPVLVSGSGDFTVRVWDPVPSD